MAEVLLRCASDSIKQAPGLPPRPPPDGDKGEMLVSRKVLIVCLHVGISVQHPRQQTGLSNLHKECLQYCIEA